MNPCHLSAELRILVAYESCLLLMDVYASSKEYGTPKKAYSYGQKPYVRTSVEFEIDRTFL